MWRIAVSKFSKARDFSGGYSVADAGGHMATSVQETDCANNKLDVQGNSLYLVRAGCMSARNVDLSS